MSIADILHTLILGPLELLFDTIFSISMRVLQRPVLSIIFLSLAINLLVLPLYNKADRMQEEEKETAARLKPRIDRIKKAFSGDERFMILQTYYRQNNYKPYYVLKGSVSLLLQIPFFMAAYNFLSGLQTIQGVSMGPIADLGRPDGILKIGGLTLNLLPILMTAINIVSGILYTKGMPLKSKIQLYGMALVFLVLLYDSPAGLVFYWTLNNVFSLLKNVVLRMKPRLQERREMKKEQKKKKKNKPEKPKPEPTPAQERLWKWLFYACCLFLTVWLGLMIPSGVLKASPGEFVDMQNYVTPLHYLLPSFLLAAGTFLLWFVIFYRLSSDKAKRRYSLLLCILAFTSVLNFMGFGTNYGNMSSYLRYDRLLPTDVVPWLINGGCVIALGVLVWLIWKKKPAFLQVLTASACLAVAAMTLVNVLGIQPAVSEIEQTAKKQTQREGFPTIPLSKTGKNVVMIMLDRAVDGFVPFIMNEKPELQDQFTGFTWYPNTLSYGIHTNICTPSLFGGYEYAPEMIQARADVSLKDKQNEALMVMPVNFMNAGWETTVYDAPYANYQWNADMSIYDKYPEIHAGSLFGTLLSLEEKELTWEQTEHIRNRNFFCYSVFRSAPMALHTMLYQSGLYNETDAAYAEGNTENMIGMTNDFINSYRALENLSAITEIREEGQNTFVMMANNVTHEVAELQEPEYIPVNYVDNTEYDTAHPIRTDAEGREIDLMEIGLFARKHYQCDVAAFQLLGRWFDYLKENGVYDNTRIILVADHGFHTGCFECANMLETARNPRGFIDPNVNEWPYSDAYNPLLLVKDFGADWHGYKTDNTFMINADTPLIAFEGNVENPVNPASGNPVTDEMKYREVHYLLESGWGIDTNNGNIFADAIHIEFRGDNIFDTTAWKIAEDSQ